MVRIHDRGANRKATEPAAQLYTQGQTDFLNVLIAQQSLYSSEYAFVQSAQTIATELISLYELLGGGWEESQTAATRQDR